jgi:NAD(P)-dependent dehydrogenase (short-subunit alcohol dehydrogenase family)
MVEGRAVACLPFFRRPMELKGTCAIVTGGGRGIGRVTAQQLAEAGSRVVVVARSTDEIDAVAGEITEAGGEAIARQVDCVNPDSVGAVVDEVIDLYGDVDILVNNAGVAIHNPIAKIRLEDWERNLAVNLTGTFVCTQAVFQHMCDRGSGHIVNVSSISGLRGHANGGAYCASKFGVVGFTEVTDVEGGPFGVKASVVCPGPTDTLMRRENHPDDVPTNLTQPEDIAEAIVFLLRQPRQAHTVQMSVRTPLM